VGECGYYGSSVNRKRTFWVGLVVLAICAAYANSFENGFHFDDFHTVVDNPAIQSLRNVPRFFTDATTFSVLPANRTYRPVVSTSLAIDYALGRGYVPLWFHIGTFLVFLGEVWLLYALYRLLLDKIRPGPANEWVALFGAAWFGLHPAMAETVNYVIQRGDLYCTVGCVGGLYVFARYPERRRFGVYLLPFVLAMLSKPPAAVFPLLLMFYCYFFESEGDTLARWKRAGVGALPSVVATGVLLGLQSAMTPKSFLPSMISPWDYRLTQPFVWLRYFGALFLPVHLNVDTDLSPFSGMNFEMVVGLVFLVALGWAIWVTARRKLLYPIAFGLIWFVVTQLPTSLYPLSEVENDHRMFFSFVGLILAVVWGVWLLIEPFLTGEGRWKVRYATVAFAVLTVAIYGYGVRQRNAVWHDEESLWKDDALKSPHNGRGLMIYGLTQMNKGAYAVALDYFERALVYTPAYPTLEINLGVVNGNMADSGPASEAAGRSAEAEKHFQRAVALAPGDDSTHAYYGRWLEQEGRFAEAIAQLQTAVQLDPQRPFNHDVLIEAYSRSGDLKDAQEEATRTLAAMPGDGAAVQALQHPAAEGVAYWINLSLAQSKQGLNEASIASARKALEIDPNSVEAYNNIGAGYGAMGQWDEAIKNEQEALRLKPDYQLAKNNLNWYTQEKAGGKSAAPAGAAASTAPGVEELINDSMRLAQAGKYEESITAARKALKLKPDSAEAWNNIAADNEAMHRWDAAIAAAKKAIALSPDFQLAKNNLAWSISQKAAGR